MAGYQDTFERVEIKYILSDEQYRELMKRLAGIAEVDRYGKTSIMNIYYDTPDYALIRRSLEKPLYKEKLRLRSYGIPDEEHNCFVEIKKKFNGIVYKRRIALPYEQSVKYLAGEIRPEKESQISREIDFFREHYEGLAPAMVVTYDRIAMAGVDNPQLRITFDTNLRWRIGNMDLRDGNAGQLILPEGQHLMELKVAGAFDLRIAGILSELKIFPTSFSKYGRAYEHLCGKRLARENRIPERQTAAWRMPVRRTEYRFSFAGR